MTILTIYGSSATGAGWTNPSNAAGGPNSTFATWVSAVRNATSSPLIVEFAAQSIPLTATLNSVLITVKGYVSSTTLLDYVRSTLYDSNLTNNPLSSTQSHTFTTTSTNVWAAYSANLANISEINSGMHLDVIADKKNITTTTTVYIDSVTIEIDYTLASPPNEGSLSASYAFTGSLTGSAPEISPNKGALAAVYEFTGLISGLAPYFGSIVGIHDWTGSLTGEAPLVVVNSGSFEASHIWSASLLGARLPAGSIEASSLWKASLDGSKYADGSFTAEFLWTASLTGVSPIVVAKEGSFEALHLWVADIFGSRESLGALELGNFVLAGSLEGYSPNGGSFEANTNWSALLNGESLRNGTFSGEHSWTAILLGSALGGGSIVASHNWGGSLDGLRDSLGAIEANANWQAILEGSHVASGYISAEYEFSASDLTGFMIANGAIEANVMWNALLYGRSKLGRRGAFIVGTM